MESADYFSEYCREINKYYPGFDVKEGQWLEEMGDMIAKAVEGMKKVPTYSACCHERLRAAF